MEVSEFETEEDFKADILAKLQLNAEQQSEARFRNEVLSKVVEASTIEIPEVMVSQEIDAMTEESSRNLKSYGIEFEQYLQMIGKSLEDHYKDMYPEAEKRVKTDLVLAKIVEVENIGIGC